MALAVERICGRIWDRPERGKLVVLFGENGSGKTTAANAICRWIKRVGPTKIFSVRRNHVQFLDVIFWSWPQLLDSFKNGNWDVVEDLFSEGVVILDELGGGHDPSFVGVDKLCQVLSKRENKWTIVTTNILPAHWEEKFDRRIASRLTDSEWIDLSDVPDFRNLKGIQA